ncbi:Uncharacterised protein [Mycobacteroides abscessus subsp. abscessus]|nr:Uncharacterised protein [Mycobacteroides abscessus subsp. abscessus]
MPDVGVLVESAAQHGGSQPELVTQAVSVDDILGVLLELVARCEQATPLTGLSKGEAVDEEGVRAHGVPALRLSGSVIR